LVNTRTSPELDPDPDPDLAVKIPDPAKRSESDRIPNTDILYLLHKENDIIYDNQQ
jgi:hypothetical protein